MTFWDGFWFGAGWFTMYVLYNIVYNFIAGWLGYEKSE